MNTRKAVLRMRRKRGVAGYQVGFEINRDLSVALIVFANVSGSGIGTGDLASKALDVLSKVKE